MSDDTEWVSLLKNYVARKRMFYNYVMRICSVCTVCKMRCTLWLWICLGMGLV